MILTCNNPHTVPDDPLSPRQAFLSEVFSGSLSSEPDPDLGQVQLIVKLAIQIPEENIPDCPVNAAKVFLAYCLGRTARPFRWMYERGRRKPCVN